jgi:hypothetical protein
MEAGEMHSVEVLLEGMGGGGAITLEVILFPCKVSLPMI